MAVLAITLLFQIPTTLAQGNKWGAHDQQIDSPFVTVAAGFYQPGPAWADLKIELGLTSTIPPRTFTKVNIYPVSGLPGDWHSAHAIGTFYVAFPYCVYDLAGGTILAMFTKSDYEMVTSTNGWTMDGTFKLDILEATGVYQSFTGGHIHMADILKSINGVGNLEECFCHIHPKTVAP